MKVLFVAMADDYGDPNRGPSFEETNFHDTLRNMSDLTVAHFDFMREMQTHGQDAMNEKLYATYRDQAPDLVFFILFRDEIYPETIGQMSEEGLAVTFNWFADDHWRFDDFSRYWAPQFDWVSTTVSSALGEYRRAGIQNVLKTQWGFNPFTYSPSEGPATHDITFVGQPHGNRREKIDALVEAGLPVEAWGQGWERGRLSQDEMVDVFRSSRVNLNLSNSSQVRTKPRWRRAVDRLRGRDPWAVPQQIKGRTFEIPGCGGFQLSSMVEEIEQYFVPDREIVLFESEPEMIERSRFYLDHETDRNRIAAAGRLRAQRDHGYDRRFRALFSKMGLPGTV